MESGCLTALPSDKEERKRIVHTSIPIPVGPEAPVTTTTLPFRLKRSMRDSALGTSIGMMAVIERMC